MADNNSYRRNAKKAARAAKKHPKAALAIAIITIIIVAAILISMVLFPQFYHRHLGLFSHTWTEWEVNQPVQCEEGVKTRKCEVCCNIQEETVPAGDHNWTEWSVTREAYCGNGSKSRECEACEETEDEIIKGSGEHEIDENTGLCKVCGYNSNAAELSIHFLELGNKYTGDCTLIKCGNTEVLIDAGSRQNSASAIRSYIDEYCEDGKIEYVIATHAHQDHIAGFVGSKDQKTGKQSGILYNYKIGTLIQFAGHKTSSNIYKNYVKAVDYAKEQGTAVYTAKECVDGTNGAKEVYYLDENKTVSLTVLKSYYYDHETNDENDYSVCVLLTQKSTNGGKDKNFLFTGDLEEKGESYLVDMNTLPEVELFKGGHHGSYTASTEKLLNVIKPKNVAVCCCCGTTEYTTNKDNTFPAQAFINRVAKWTENIYCTTLMIDYKTGNYTSMNGNIVFYTKDGELLLECSNNNTVLKDTEWFKKNRDWPAYNTDGE